MKRLSIISAYFIAIVSYIFCADLPTRDIDMKTSSFTCSVVDKIDHDLDLPRAITSNLNRICWRQDSVGRNEFYLVAVSARRPNEGKAVDISFIGSQAQVIYLSKDKFEFKVFGATNETWHIVCTFSQRLLLSHAKVLFNNIYGDIQRGNVTLQSFSATRITKGGSPFTGKTFIYVQKGIENTTLIFTQERERLANPVLVISKGDFNVTSTNIVAFTGTLLVFNDPRSLYVLYFEDEDTTVEFAKCFCPLSLH